MTANDFFRACAIGYKACGFDGAELAREIVDVREQMGVDTAEGVKGPCGKGSQQARLEQLYGAGLADALFFLGQSGGIGDSEFVFNGHEWLLSASVKR